MKNSGNIALFVAAAVALLLKLTLALTTYGTNDVIAWESHLETINDKGVLAWYRDGAVLHADDGRSMGVQSANHPPFMIHLLRGWGGLTALSGLPFPFWLRATSSLADIGMLVLLWKYFNGSKSGGVLNALLLVALSPVSIMVSGFHGNTDSIMMFFVLLSIWTIERKDSAWLAGVAFGMAMNIKILPVIFALSFILYLPGVLKRIHFVAAAGITVMSGSIPYVIESPSLLIDRILGYSPMAGIWGLSLIGATFLPPDLNALYLSIGKAIAFSVVALASIWMSRRSSKPTLFVQCGAVAFLFLFVAPGFGLQYLAWLVPWGAALTCKRLLTFYVTSGSFLIACYTLWSGGFPWYLANFAGPSVFDTFWSGLIVFSIGIVCWMSTGRVVYTFYESIACPKMHRTDWAVAAHELIPQLPSVRR